MQASNAIISSTTNTQSLMQTAAENGLLDEGIKLVQTNILPFWSVLTFMERSNSSQIVPSH